jgi:hypothetical protein
MCPFSLGIVVQDEDVELYRVAVWILSEFLITCIVREETLFRDTADARRVLCYAVQIVKLQ